MKHPNDIEYPYIPPGRVFKFVPANNPFMQAAKEICDQQTGCVWWPTGAVLVRDGEIKARGANFGDLQPVCERRERNCPTGTGYEHCSVICKQQGHAEVCCVKQAVQDGIDTDGADIYVYGHWWCCQNCWDTMIKHGIRDVYLMENADTIFTYQKRLEHYESLKQHTRAGKKITYELAKWMTE